MRRTMKTRSSTKDKKNNSKSESSGEKDDEQKVITKTTARGDMPRLFPIPPPSDDQNEGSGKEDKQKSIRKTVTRGNMPPLPSMPPPSDDQNEDSSTKKSKPPRPMSASAPITRPAAKSQEEALNLPVLRSVPVAPRTAAKPFGEQKSAGTRNTNRPTVRSSVAKLPPPSSEQKKSSSSTKPKPPLLRSVPAPITCGASRSLRSTYSNLSNSSAAPTEGGSNPSREENSTETKTRKRPARRPVTAKSRTEITKQAQASKSAQNAETKSPLLTSPVASVQQEQSRRLEILETPKLASNQPASTNKIVRAQASSKKDALSSSPSVGSEVVAERIAHEKENSKKTNTVLEEAKSLKRNKKQLSMNNIERARGKRLPLPIGEPVPPERRVTRQASSRSVTKVTSKSRTGGNSARGRDTKKASPDKSPPAKRARRNPHTPSTDVAGKSSRSVPRIKNTRNRTSQASANPDNVPRKPSTTVREAVSFLSDEYDSESPLKYIQGKNGTSGSSSGYESTYESSEDESDSNQPPSPRVTRSRKNQVRSGSPAEHDMGNRERRNSDKDSSDIESSEDGSEDNIKPEPRPTSGGKTITKRMIETLKKEGLDVDSNTTADTQKRESVERPTAQKSAAGKSVVGKGVARKIVAGKTAAHKTIAGKSPPQMKIPSRRVHAGGIQHDSRPENADHISERESRSESRESDGAHEERDEEKVKCYKSEDRKRTRTYYEKRRADIRKRCSKYLQKKQRSAYTSSVREEFFLEMEYHMYLKRQLKNGGAAVIDDLKKIMILFDKNIASLRLDGLKALGCVLEAQNYNTWLKVFRLRRRVLMKTTDLAWKENFHKILHTLKSAHYEAEGKNATVPLDDDDIKYMIKNWEFYKLSLEAITVFSSELFRIHEEGGGCQLQ